MLSPLSSFSLITSVKVKSYIALPSLYRVPAGALSSTISCEVSVIFAFGSVALVANIAPSGTEKPAGRLLSTTLSS